MSRWLVLLTITASTVACTRGGDSRGNDAGAGAGGRATGVGGSSASTGGAMGSGGAGGRTSTADASVGGGGGALGGRRGAAGNTGDAGVDARTDEGTSFASVLKVFKDRCVSCHTANAFAAPKTTLYLTADVAYNALVGMPADETCGGIFVVPGDSSQSYLVRKLADATPCDGAQMPMAYEGPFMPLNAGEMATIVSWIDEGARP
jgi:hypothetical protein